MNTYLATFLPPTIEAGAMYAHGSGDAIAIAPPSGNPYVMGGGPQPAQAIVTAEDMVQAASRVLAANVAPPGFTLSMIQLIAVPVVRGMVVQ